MTANPPITILVLGPMAPIVDDRIVRATRTVDLVRLLTDMVGADARIDGPDDNASADIIPGILGKIERADLVVLDLTGNSAGVMYELGLVHALGLPYICLTSDSQRPFYVRTAFCITRFELADAFDQALRTHHDLRQRLRQFFAAHLDPPQGEARLEDFASNPVSAFFGGLPVVDISAPAGLAAGYWRNAVRRFVRHGGYFEAPDRVVGLRIGGGVVETTLPIRHFVAVRPPSGLNAAQDDDLAALRAMAGSAGYSLLSGNIRQADQHDMRDFGVTLLGRPGPDGVPEAVSPGIVIDLPTTLYALQYSPRIMRIDQLGVGAADRPAIERLRRRRYDHMIGRFAAILDYYLRNAENRGHGDQVHFIDLAALPELLGRLVPGH